MMIAIIDYGMGNIHSVKKALELCGAQTVVTNKPSQMISCDKVVLPGVGAFADALLEFKKQGLAPAISEHIKKKKPFLGICLGMQLLFQKSQEANKAKGLSILRGGVERFADKKGLKVPHIGWNQLKKVTKSPLRLHSGQASYKVTSECPLLEDIPDESYVYFCHSYYPRPKDKNIIAANTDYGIDFPAVIWQDNIYGVQFHPEKSQQVGLKIIKNFVEL